jgi:hypothetical protein
LAAITTKALKRTSKKFTFLIVIVLQHFWQHIIWHFQNCLFLAKMKNKLNILAPLKREFHS